MSLFETVVVLEGRVCRARHFGRSFAVQLFTLLLGFRGAAGLPAEETEAWPSLFVTVSAGMFAATNKNDAKAAIQVWADTLASAQGIRVAAQTEVCEDLATLRKAIFESRADAVSLRIDEYFQISEDDSRVERGRLKAVSGAPPSLQPRMIPEDLRNGEGDELQDD